MLPVCGVCVVCGVCGVCVVCVVCVLVENTALAPVKFLSCISTQTQPVLRGLNGHMTDSSICFRPTFGRVTNLSEIFSEFLDIFILSV